MTFRTLATGVTLILAAVSSIAIAALYMVSQRKLTAVYGAPMTRIAVPSDPASISRGAHLVEAIGTCAVCHGADYGGAVYADIPFVGIVAGPNLTRGRGGIGGSLTDEDWVRALRYGVRRDGTSLIAMPSEVFTHFNDADLGSLIAYLKQLPRVDREMPATRFRFGGRLMLAVGRFNILTAPKTTYTADSSAAPDSNAPDSSSSYGAYLARVAGCAGCHGTGLSGGRVAGPPNLPLAANITPSGIGAWTEADFVRAMREGRRPDGRVLDGFMPWRYYGQMSDAELHALWTYLRSVPRRPFGNK
jgi:cytochrome c553